MVMSRLLTLMWRTHHRAVDASHLGLAAGKHRLGKGHEETEHLEVYVQE